MKHQALFYLLALASLLLYTCNPECTTYTVVEATVEPELRFPGEEILVKTNPSDFLKNRELFMENSADNSAGVLQIASDFDLQLGGRIATLDTNLTNTGIQQLYVQDDDCGGLISLESLNVVDETFSNFNPSLFVTPSPSIIIIPPPISPNPTNIVNTWFSPEDHNYCIWFVPQMDTTFIGSSIIDCIAEGIDLVPGNIAEESGSRELSCEGTGIGHNNPVTGFIDKTSGQVSFTINREAKGLGVEKFVGRLVEPNSLPPDYVTNGGFCEENPSSQPIIMMVVKSELTGRTLVLYRENPPDLMENNPC
jgi:hypothetical protein